MLGVGEHTRMHAGAHTHTSYSRRHSQGLELARGKINSVSGTASKIISSRLTQPKLEQDGW